MIHGKIEMLNAKHNTKYKPGLDTDTIQYTPHITIVSQEEIRKVIGEQMYESNQDLQLFKNQSLESMNDF